MSNWVCEDKEVLKKHLNMLALETIDEIVSSDPLPSDHKDALKIARIMGVRDLFRRICIYLAEDINATTT